MAILKALWSFLGGNKWAVIGALLLVAVVAGAFKYQAGRIDRLAGINAAQALELGKVIVANQSQAGVISELTEARKRDSEAITYKDGLIHELNEELAAKRREIAGAARSDPEYRDWESGAVPALVNRMLSGGPAGGGSDGAYPANTAPGADAALPQAGMERRDQR